MVEIITKRTKDTIELFSGRNSELAVVMEVEMNHVTVTDTSSTCINQGQVNCGNQRK